MTLASGMDEEITVYSACGHPQAGPDFRPTIHMLKLKPDGSSLRHVQELELPTGSAMPMCQVASEKTGKLMVYSVASSRGILVFRAGASGELALVGEQVTVLGDQSKAGPCHLCFDHTESWLFVCNYDHGSVAVLCVRDDGLLQPPKVYPHGPGAFEGCSVGSWGSGGYQARQEQAHPHGAFLEPRRPFVHVADLGMNAVVVYALDISNGGLTQVWATKLHEGSGPRHLDFSVDGRYTFVVNELDNTVTTLRGVPVCRTDTCINDGIDVSASISLWEKLGTVSTLPRAWADSEPPPTKPFDFYSAPNHSSELLVSPDGRFVYVSNRGHDSIACFAVDHGGSGCLSLVECFPLVSSRLPWTFAFAGHGDLMIVQNQYSAGQPPQSPGSLSILRIDKSSGKLTDTGVRWESPHVMSVLAVPTNLCLHHAKKRKASQDCGDPQL